ncbi:MAG: MarR family winged helix-turn-helix transcriptional regulator [Dehalococcoidia bacterium]
MSTDDASGSSLELRFRSAYWQALRDIDVVRLRQWEQWHVTLPQLRVLYQVRRTPGITTGELARILGITVSTTSGLVGKLADRGLVERLFMPDNRRQIPLQLTPEGLALVGELRGPSVAFLAEVIHQLGDSIEDVASALEKLASASAAARAVLPALEDREPVETETRR